MNLKTNFRPIAITILCLIIAYVFVFILHFYLLRMVFEMTQTTFNKYLIFHLHPIDTLLLDFYPLLFLYPILLRKLPFAKSMLWSTLLGLGLISISLATGYFIALNTWTNNGLSSLLPEYIKYQPYSYYWTLFILSGIVFPFLRLFYKTNKKEEGVIDAT